MSNGTLNHKTLLTRTHRHISKMRVNHSALGEHHILQRIEKDKSGNVIEEEIVMWGGHDSVRNKE
jgi:hypothetical protein